MGPLCAGLHFYLERPLGLRLSCAVTDALSLSGLVYVSLSLCFCLCVCLCSCVCSCVCGCVCVGVCVCDIV